jgi:acetyl esterase
VTSVNPARRDSVVLDLEPLLDPELRPAFLAPRTGVRDILGRPPGVTHRTAQVPGDRTEPPVPVRVYRPAAPATAAGAVLYVHGGGFVAGSPEQFDPLCDYYSHVLGCVVVAPAYRLAPHHPHPAAVTDVYRTLCWLVGAAAGFGAAGDRLALVGTSAGGAIAASVALLARDRGGPAIAQVSLQSPCLDDRHETPSSRQITDPRTWHRAASVHSWQLYLGDHRPGPDGYAVPARAADLAALPPTHLSVGQLEVGRDETVDHARRLTAAGVPTELHVYPAATHGFELKAPQAAVSRASLATQVAVLRQAITG